MVGTIIAALVVGAILGALARLIMPGKQNIGVLVTILLGAVGALLGSWLSSTLLGTEQGEVFAIGPFLIGLVVAILLIAIYVGIAGRRGAPRT